MILMKELKPQKVFDYFKEISAIPRCSKNEKMISDYLVNFAEKNKLEVYQDKALNIIIKKNGTKGYEDSSPVIIQGHMDMVCEKVKESKHDFSKDPISLSIKGDFLRANGTTLGGDNGIAIYMRPIALPLLFLLPMAGWIKHRRATVMAKDLGVSLAAAAILMTPWALRNERLYGEPALVSTNLGVNLWMGNNPASDGGFMTPPKKTGNEDQQDKAFRAEAMTFIKAEPGRYVVLTLNRVRKTFDRETSGVTWNPALPDKLVKPLKLLSSLFWWIVASAALLGLTGWLRRDWRAVIDPLTLSPAVVVSTSVFIVASERYHMPVGPFAAIFAALLLARWNAPAFAPPAAAPERLPRGSQ